MLKWLKLSHQDHSGRLRPHQHTSYLPLGIFLLAAGFALTVFTASAASPPPQAGSVGLTGTMPGKPPTIAATITTPNNQQHFSTSPVKFSGSCPAKTLVELFKNDIFAGSTPCTDAGVYSIDIDLLIGQNTVVARVYDDLNQPGPDSNTVVVYYDAVPSQTSPLAALNFGGAQLILNTDAVFRGTFPNQELNIPVEILGGAPPYALNVQWGDADNKVVPRSDNAPFKVGHVYDKPGTYQISLQATDAQGRVAFLTVASIVNGQPLVAAATAGASLTKNQLLILWPLYVSTFAVVVSFWLGERREKQLLSRRGLLLPS